MMCDCDQCNTVRNSAAVVMALSPRTGIDALDATLLVLAIALDKPIILVCPPGLKVPEKLAKVIDRFVEYDPDPKKVVAAIKETMIDMGLVCDDPKSQFKGGVDMKTVIRTAPGATEKTYRTRKMRRPTRCNRCGITQSISRIVRFVRKMCAKCRANERCVKPRRKNWRDDR